MNKIFDNKATVAALVLPGLAILVFALFVPIGFSAWLGLTDWEGFGASTFIGFDNYVEILTADPVFWQALGNVFWLMFATIFLQNPVAFALAATLSNLPARLSQALRTIFFIPAVLSIVVLSALWLNILNPTYGILNKALVAVGLGGWAHSWLSDPTTALGSIVWITVWAGFGWALMFYYTGLMTVPKELTEAAKIDGAGRLRSYWNVVIPHMLPSITAVIVIDVISCMKQMEVVFLTTQGGPGAQTQFLAVHLYQQAFVASRYGFGNALSVVFVVIAVGLTLLVQRLLRTEDPV